MLMKSRICTVISVFLCVVLCLTGCRVETDQKKVLNTIQDSWKFSDNPDIELAKIVEKIDSVNALLIARKYYELALPKIESDLVNEFRKVMNWTPVFDGSDINAELCRTNSMNVAATVTYTNAKNYYLALASAVFTLDPKNINAASNLATAIATYYDDLQIEGNGSVAKEKEFYSDAEGMYYYALSVSDKAIWGKENLVTITCLGNLFLDMKKFEQAYGAFKAALEIDKTYNPARTGLYNYYMATKQIDKAFALVASGAEYMPVFVRAVQKISDKVEREDLDVPEDSDVEKLEQVLDKFDDVPEVTVADFIEEIDPKTAEKMRKDMNALKSEMTFKAPNLDALIDRLKTFEEMSNPPALAALEELGKEISNLEIGNTPAGVEAMLNKQLDQLKDFGVDVELGFDPENLSEIIQKAIKNPEKYENWKPDIKINGIEDIQKKAGEYASEISEGILAAHNGSSGEAYEQLAKTNPVYNIFLINPYDFLNPRDIIVQRFNVSALTSKMTAYKKYWSQLNEKYGIADTLVSYSEVSTPVLTEYGKYLGNIETSNISEEEKMIEHHKLHEKYYPKLNEIAKPFWAEATTKASQRYKKIEKYCSKMYSDCMKHIMLISDFEIRDRLEDELKSMVYQNIQDGIQQVLTAYTFVHYYDINTCGCDPEYLKMLEKELEKKRVELAKERAKEREKFRQDRKNFDNMILDEKSQFYKEKIKKYEYVVDFFIYKYTSNPYKSITQCKFDFVIGSFSGSKLVNHYRNTTTYDAELELGRDISIGEGKNKMELFSLKGGFGFTATKQSDGNYYPEDIDIRAKLEAGAYLSDHLHAKVGVEASAVRGTRGYAELAVTGNKKLDEMKKQRRARFIPTDASITLWEGQYIIK